MLKIKQSNYEQISNINTDLNNDNYKSQISETTLNTTNNQGCEFHALKKS